MSGRYFAPDDGPPLEISNREFSRRLHSHTSSAGSGQANPMSSLSMLMRPPPPPPHRSPHANGFGQAGGNLYCASCDRRFRSFDEKQQHEAEHVRCFHPGCPYIAHASLIQQHYDLQHRTLNAAQAKQIWSLNTPEEVEKWRNDRKRRFPTQQVVEAKRLDLEERKARGEVIREAAAGRRIQSTAATASNNSGEKKTGGTAVAQQGAAHQRRNKKQFEQKKVFRREHQQFYRDQDVGSGVVDALADVLRCITDVEFVVSNLVNSVCRAGKTPQQIAAERQARHHPPAPAPLQPQRRLADAQQHARAIAVRSNHSTLIGRLLSREIRRERNAIMQCIRYICQHNFFDDDPA